MTAERSPRGWGALALPREAGDSSGRARLLRTGSDTSAASRPPGFLPDPGWAVVVLARLRSDSVPWAVVQLARGGRPWRAEPGLRFVRVLGSGHEGGFGLRPGIDHQGVFMMFDDVADAMRCVWRSPRVAAYRERAEQCLVAVLQTSSARGRWGGQAMRAIAPSPGPGEPLVALTRASIRPTQALRFWRHSPASESALAAAPGCRLAVGLGEAPVLRQATLSLWDDVAAMNAYARTGAHQRAIEASTREGYFSESMFVRFVPLWMQGRWAGSGFDFVRPGVLAGGDA